MLFSLVTRTICISISTVLNSLYADCSALVTIRVDKRMKTMNGRVVVNDDDYGDSSHIIAPPLQSQQTRPRMLN